MLQALLGLINCFQIFIPNVKALLNQLLLKKGKWTDKCQKAFDELKKHFNIKLIINAFLMLDILVIDVSDHGVGAVLLHKY